MPQLAQVNYNAKWLCLFIIAVQQFPLGSYA